MGCFHSKSKSKQKDEEASVDISVSQESDGLGIASFVAMQNDKVLSFSSSSSESSSDCELPQVRPRYNLVEKLAVGIHNLNASELDDSSIESSSLPKADGTTFSN